MKNFIYKILTLIDPKINEDYSKQVKQEAFNKKLSWISHYRRGVNI